MLPFCPCGLQKSACAQVGQGWASRAGHHEEFHPDKLPTRSAAGLKGSPGSRVLEGSQSAPGSPASRGLELRQRFNSHPPGWPPQRQLPPALLSVPGASGERLVRWPAARKGLVRPRLHRPVLQLAPSAPFIDRQIRRRRPWRFQRRSRAPCWVAGIRAHLMAGTPNKPGAAFAAEAHRGGGWERAAGRNEGVRRPTQARGLPSGQTPRQTLGAGETSGLLGPGPRPDTGGELGAYQETRSREAADGDGETRANSSRSATLRPTPDQISRVLGQIRVAGGEGGEGRSLPLTLEDQGFVTGMSVGNIFKSVKHHA